ncbi:phosphoheptose isomerase [Candidatus Beckwithbacteria bacterium]|nr:phosphoheptose isomerase [Candidatus Beckwithbacteria bacterium]
MSINSLPELTKALKKEEIVKLLKTYFKEENLKTVEENVDKPWGAYFKFDEKDLEKFTHLFFGPIDVAKFFNQKLKYDPKILLVEPGKKLSWQYHHRRSELWTVLQADVAIDLAKNDKQSKQAPKYQKGDIIKIPVLQRHRLIGLNNWGLVAEIWLHSNKDKPSDENDIVRVDDDFGRK